MTTPPLPESPCLRVRLDYTAADGALLGSRFFLSYSGSPPSGTACTTIASDIAAAWASHLQGHVNEYYALTEVDVLDIATDSGYSGQWLGSNAGTDSTQQLPGNAAVNIEYNIARRYRGGKPRMFLPPPGAGSLTSPRAWSSTYVTNLNTDFAAFMTEVEAISVGGVGTLAHVNLSYYQGFKNLTNSSGRERAVPQYRTEALLDTISGYSVKAVVGSQRRRRTSTTY